jgi:hypothetical protein
MRRSESKEAYKIWYGFLRRALASNACKVNKQKYAAWGGVENTTFTSWWRETGARLLDRRKVAIVADGEKPTKNTLLVSVPVLLTPTEAANQLRRLLLEHYKSNSQKRKPSNSIQMTQGKEIKIRSFRAYLRTYDAYQKLKTDIELGRLKVKSVNRTGGKGGALAVPSKLLVEEVRRIYAENQRRYRNSIVKVDPLPKALADTVDNYNGALKAIARYLKQANQILANVANGDFPGNY